MAELNNSCCAPEAQASCCEPEDKAGCCGHGDGCGCSAGEAPVINLSGDKPKVLAEAARVLRPGGRFAVSNVIADPDMDEATRADMAAWRGCIAGALTEAEFRDALTAAGLIDIEIRPTTACTSTPPPRSSAPESPPELGQRIAQEQRARAL